MLAPENLRAIAFWGHWGAVASLPVIIVPTTSLPAGGLIVNSNMTHYLEAREAAAGEQRRFDLVGIYCNISLYSKQ